HARFRGMDIDAARGGRPRLHIGGQAGRGDAPRGFILIKIVRFEARRDHLAHARFRQVLQVLSRQAVRLAESLLARMRGVGEDCAFGVFYGDRSEFHAATLLLAESPRERSASMISASTAAAISAGLAAPIFSPMGARIRSIAAGETPASVSRSTRLAWVFRLPRAPT